MLETETTKAGILRRSGGSTGHLAFVSVRQKAAKSTGAKAYRDAVLDLAHDHAFARGLVNSGRLTTATVLTGSPLNSYDQGFGEAGVAPGAPCPSVPATAPRIRSRT